MKLDLLEPRLTINPIDQNSIEQMTSIDETCVSFEPAVSIEVFKLLSEPHSCTIQINKDFVNTVTSHGSPLDEHEQALARN